MIKSLKTIFHFLKPPAQWQTAVIILLGFLVGFGILIFHISNASSYLSSDPQTCINCHVMVPQYATWQRSSHTHTASCMDCHVPHDNVVHKYAFKMKDGFRHASMFTLRLEPQVIRIKPDGKAVVQENCLRCHENVLQNVSIHKVTYEDSLKGEGKLCWDCHREVPHGRVRSLSATPYARTPSLKGEAPAWVPELIKFLEKFKISN